MLSTTVSCVGFRGACIALAVFLVAAPACPAWAQTPTVTQIEEDWELVIGAPSPSADAPQVTTLISPLGNVDSLYATFVVNHHDAPAYKAGGLQLQVWDGEDLLVSRLFPNQALLATPGETIRWTQVMRETNDGMVFEIINGSSTTWGNFGDEGTLKATLPTSLANLNGYSPDVSVENSGVNYAANRVQSLVLKRVRAYTATDEIIEDATPRTVHTLNE